MTTSKQKGDKGEDIAEKYLQKNNFKVLTTNYRFLKAEVDIIAIDLTDNELVFVEVKTRATANFGNPEEFVSIQQQKRIIKAAHQFIVSNNRTEDARFDIISIIMINKTVKSIEHLKDAFYPTL